VGSNHLILTLEDISFNYSGGPKVLADLDLQLFKGDRIGLMGPNGSGKTTLFQIIMGLLKPSSGSIEIYNTPRKTEKDFIDVRKKIGLLFQDADDQLFSPTVLEDVAFGPLNLGKSRDEALEISLNTLNFLGLSGFEKLVSLATVLAMEPEVLLLDEPTSGLDEKTKITLKNVLTRLDLSYIIISHEIDFLADITDHIYTMGNGKILFDQEVHAHQHVHAHPHGAYVHEHK
jgi:cobalt/nickel transport system ATP-binding protein